ncbi:MAG TPA: hypothetical protein VKV04_11995 [Verrucomicrobiae bacterium]|nr:hypothetical protein [Verrucomicrobiae bacterium]
MKKSTIILPLMALCCGMALLHQTAHAQLTLTGTNYTQNFDTISNGLPAGWSVRTSATATNLGTITTNYNAAGNTWGANAGEFRNCASTMSDAGTNFNGGEPTGTQTNCLNRALAVRQTGSFGDPGAVFVLQISNTLGLSNLTLSVDLCLLRTNGYITVWTIQYAIGNSPASFITLGTYTNSTFFGATTETYNLGSNANNLSSNVWIRIAALSPATGSGSRATFGIDNFSLSWTANGIPVTSPSITGIILTNGSVQIDFTGDASDNPSAFSLQCVGQCSDAFGDSGAAITQTSPGHFRAVCAKNGSQQFYRIRRP